MRFRSLDSNNDWQLGQGVGSYAREAAALTLDIRTRLRAWKGNCFFSRLDGVDYHNLMEKNQKNNLIQDISNVLLQTNGVVQINSVSVSFNAKTRGLDLAYDIQTIFTRSFQQTIANIAGAANA